MPLRGVNERQYLYYDPVHLLPEAGQAWWRAQALSPVLVTRRRGALLAAAQSRREDLPGRLDQQ